MCSAGVRGRQAGNQSNTLTCPLPLCRPPVASSWHKGYSCYLYPPSLLHYSPCHIVVSLTLYGPLFFTFLTFLHLLPPALSLLPKPNSTSLSCCFLLSPPSYTLLPLLQTVLSTPSSSYSFLLPLHPPLLPTSSAPFTPFPFLHPPTALHPLRLFSPLPLLDPHFSHPYTQACSLQRGDCRGRGDG